ncbi:Transcription factor bHLH68 [Zea mays]|uniref:Transcription factor bHLH68 n=1 Tax=Zea mays TaxID=4577 RepID=A0A1D6J9A8_MAIZE|nr:Transcription factor bHLH68 [Zea mays]
MCPARSLSTALRCAHPSLNPPARVGLVLSFPSTTSPPPSPGASSFSSPGYQDEITGRAARRPPREEALAPRARLRATRTK